MANLRHGSPVILSGWLEKEGKLLKSKNRRYLKLHGTMLSNHRDENSPATWEISVVDCSVAPGTRPFELVITSPQKKLSLFASSDEDFKNWCDALKRATASGVGDFYSLGRLLGEGAFAQVRLGIDRESGEKFAVKVIKKRNLDPRELDFILREVNILKSVTHPNIVNTYDVFDMKDSLHLVLEFMEGGELFDIIADEGQFSEQAASQVMRDVVKGVQYLHMHSIVHRDIKPENILCKSKGKPLQVKLADFGLANFSEDGTVQESIGIGAGLVGTPGYVAPEVVKGEQYGPAVDLWACGVILYIMLSGKMPFYGRDDNECLRRIAGGIYDFPDREWAQISDKAKSLVRALLQVDPGKRLTANAALQHEWLAEPSELSDTPIPNDLSGIHSSRRKFKKAVMAAMTVGKMKELMSNKQEEDANLT